MNIKVTGVEELKRKLEVFKNVLDPAIAESLKKIANEVRDEAKENCPVDTGSLRKSIRTRVYARQIKKIKRVGVSAGGFITNPKTGNIVNYAVHVEFGTSRRPATPYMRPAVYSRVHKVVKYLMQNLTRWIS